MGANGRYPQAGPVRVTINKGDGITVTRIDPPKPGGVGPGDTLKWWHGVGRGTDPVAYLEGLTPSEDTREDFGYDDWYLEGGERVYPNRV